MTIPMIVLAFGSVFAGGFFSIGDRFLNWLEPVTGHAHGDSPLSAATVTGATMVVLVIGVAIAWAMYGRRPVPVVAPRGSLLTRAARRDLLQDDFNHVVLVRGGEHLTRSLVYVDHTLVDGVVNGTAASFGGLSGRLRKLQNGYARTYAVSMFGGTAVAHRRDPADEGGLSMSFPLLTATAALPAIGAIATAAVPAARRTAAKWLALLFSLATLVLAAVVARPLRARRRPLSAHRIPRLDQGLRRPVRTGRGRHRGGAAGADRPADPLRDPGRLARRRPPGDASPRAGGRPRASSP